MSLVKLVVNSVKNMKLFMVREKVLPLEDENIESIKVKGTLTKLDSPIRKTAERIKGKEPGFLQKEVFMT